jgi:glycosyltransferase involved in cell wall biosynthesis
MAIKISYVVDFFRTLNGGTEKQFGYLLTHLPKSGFSVQLLSFQDSPFLKEEAQNLFPGVAVSSLGASSDISKSPTSLIRLLMTLRRSGPDLIHTFFPTSNSLGVLIARLAGVRKIVSSRRDMGFNLSKKEVRLLKIANRFVSCIVANSEAAQNCTIALEGVARSKTRVIYNGVSPDNFGDSLASRRGNEQIVGIVANLNRPVKRVDLFIRAAALVSENHSGVNFWIIGDGYLRDELERLARDLGVNSHMTFLGGRKDVGTLLQKMTIGVICSDSESLSNAIMEYMAAGLPVVATDVGGNPELVEHGKTGLTVKADDPYALSKGICELLDDRERAVKMGEAGRRTLQKRFSIEKMIGETREIYESLAQ